MRCADNHRAPRKSPRHSRALGFTLLEVMVALVVGALVLQSATSITHAMRAHSAALHLHIESIEARRSATRELRTLLEQTDARVLAPPVILGDREHLTFATWCSVPQGWQKPCRSTLEWQPQHTPGRQAGTPAKPNRLTLALRTSDGPDLIIASNVERGELRYLASASNGGEWYRAWTTPSAAPIAIALLIERDTLLFRVGAIG